MEFVLDQRRAYAYTGGTPFQPARPIVLFIHGAQHDHGVWTLPARWFAHHGFSVLAVDLPGHGRSEGPALHSIEALAGWIAALVAEVTKVSPGATAPSPPRTTLVGHSMGSLAALDCAARYPERIARLVMIGTAVPMPVSDALLVPARDDEARAMAMINDWSHSAQAAIGGNAVPGLWLTGANLRLMERQAAGVLHNDLAACNAYAGGTAAAMKLTQPTLIVSGGRDAMTSPRSAAKFAASIPHARIATIPAAGHSIMSEQPDALLDILCEFITLS